MFPEWVSECFRNLQGTNNEKGTGLGLIICKEFIDKNDGYIEIESEIDKGSLFKIFLPIKKSQTTEL